MTRDETGYSDPIQQTIFMKGYKQGQNDAARSCVIQVNKQYDEAIDKVKQLIVEEILIANAEGQPTSRLTSLAMKL